MYVCNVASVGDITYCILTQKCSLFKCLRVFMKVPSTRTFLENMSFVSSFNRVPTLLFSCILNFIESLIIEKIMLESF